MDRIGSTPPADNLDALLPAAPDVELEVHGLPPHKYPTDIPGIEK